MKRLLMLLLVVLCSCNELNSTSSMEYNSTSELELSIGDKILSYIFELRIQHPHIVYAQAVLESGNFTSNVWKENHNCVGMRLAYQRPTTALGSNRGHAVYRSWKECILDYAIWQSIYARNLTEGEYYVKLQSVYAEDENYVSRLKELNLNRWEE